MRYLFCGLIPEYVHDAKRQSSVAQTGSMIIVEFGEYETEYIAPEGESVRRRVGFNSKKGEIVRFVFQLEYLFDPDPREYRVVVRSDHDHRGAAIGAHNVAEDGIHIDRYSQGEKVQTRHIHPPVAANTAFSIAEDHILQHSIQYITAFEKWHGISQ